VLVRWPGIGKKLWIPWRLHFNDKKAAFTIVATLGVNLPKVDEKTVEPLANLKNCYLVPLGP